MIFCSERRTRIALVLLLLFAYMHQVERAYAAQHEKTCIRREKSRRKCLIEAYLTNSSSHYLFGIAGIRMQKYFGPGAKEVVWVGRFRLLSNLTATFEAVWYSPDGKIFYQHSFEAFCGNARYALTNLSVKDNIPASLYGKWKLRIFWGEDMIDERFFYIDTKENIKKVQDEESKGW